MGQKDGEKWTAAVDFQPTIPKSDRLLGARAKDIPGQRSMFIKEQELFTAAPLTIGLAPSAT